MCRPPFSGHSIARKKGFMAARHCCSGDVDFVASHGHYRLYDRMVMLLSMASSRRPSCEPVWPL